METQGQQRTPKRGHIVYNRKHVGFGLLIYEIENNELMLSRNINVLLSYRSFNLYKVF